MDETSATGADYDLLIIGGGINGAGIARDAAGRGLSVLLCEQDDLAAHTSSASTKLVHGGLRYLEHCHFGLVRKALAEREVLLRAAPHIIRPLRFIMPLGPDSRPAWLIRLGLFIYDHLGGRDLLPASRSVDLRRHHGGAALRPEIRRGFVYSDCWVEDSRLVVINAMDARERGATIRPRTIVTAAHREGGHWLVTLRDARGTTTNRIRARSLVNAAGPWVATVLDSIGDVTPSHRRVRLVKGSHIIVRSLFDHGDAYVFQNPDRRIVFAIPFEEAFTLIGTTDVPFSGDPAGVTISAGEVDYLCAAVNRYLASPITAADVIRGYAGVRPLQDDAATDAATVTRDYVLELDAPPGVAPLLSVFGGKITTYRRLAEEALALLGPPLGVPDRPWTTSPPLPGGDIPAADTGAWLAGFRQRHPYLPEPLARRYVGSYGTRAEILLAGATCLADLGTHLGDGIHSAELAYLARQEWAQTADDVLWRRSRLGLHVHAETRRAVEAWFRHHDIQPREWRRTACENPPG